MLAVYEVKHDVHGKPPVHLQLPLSTITKDARKRQ